MHRTREARVKFLSTVRELLQAPEDEGDVTTEEEVSDGYNSFDLNEVQKQKVIQWSPSRSTVVDLLEMWHL